MRLFWDSSYFQQWPLFTMPFFLIFWPGGMWGTQALLLMVWLVCLDSQQRDYRKALRSLWELTFCRYLFVVVIGYCLWSVVSIAFLHSVLQSIDNGLIFLLWCLSIPVIQQLKPSYVFLGYGFLLALIFALALALFQFHWLNLSRAFGLYGSSKSGSGAIKFGDMALLFGVLTLIFLSEQKTKFLGMLGLLLGLLICAYASSRGGLFALVLCIPVWRFAIKDNRRVGFKSMTLVLAGGLGLFGLNAAMDNVILARILETEAELKSILALDFSSPAGIRLHLWYLALVMFINHPILGVGLNNFGKALKEFNQQNVFSDETLHYAHAHNEYLCALATGGIVGFTITALLFIVPIKLFRRDYHANAWAKAGFWSACLMSFFALTDCVFDRRMTVIAYIALIAVCLGGNRALKKVNGSC